MKKLTAEKIKVAGDVPSPRFGHTFTMVSNSKAVLFGGAVSLAGIFFVTKASSSSPTKHFSSISRRQNGQN